jgi:hypothetical protein
MFLYFSVLGTGNSHACVGDFQPRNYVTLHTNYENGRDTSAKSWLALPPIQPR